MPRKKATGIFCASDPFQFRLQQVAPLSSHSDDGANHLYGVFYKAENELGITDIGLES